MLFDLTVMFIENNSNMFYLTIIDALLIPQIHMARLHCGIIISQRMDS